PRLSVSEYDEWNAGVKGILQSLPDADLCSSRLLHLYENRWLRWWMAKAEISSAFAGLKLRPNNVGVESVPVKFRKNSENDSLRNGLFVWETAFAEFAGDIFQDGVKHSVL